MGTQIQFPATTSGSSQLPVTLTQGDTHSCYPWALQSHAQIHTQTYKYLKNLNKKQNLLTISQTTSISRLLKKTIILRT